MYLEVVLTNDWAFKSDNPSFSSSKISISICSSQFDAMGRQATSGTYPSQPAPGEEAPGKCLKNKRRLNNSFIKQQLMNSTQWNRNPMESMSMSLFSCTCHSMFFFFIYRFIFWVEAMCLQQTCFCLQPQTCHLDPTTPDGFFSNHQIIQILSTDGHNCPQCCFTKIDGASKEPLWSSWQRRLPSSQVLFVLLDACSFPLGKMQKKSKFRAFQ